MSDGRCPWRPARHHFGVTSFGVNGWTAREAGDRILNEHVEDERDPGRLRADDLDDDSNEELYLVHRGRARFELDGERVAAPAGTFVFVPPRIKRTAFAEEPGTTIVLTLALDGASRFRGRLRSLAAEDSDFDPIRDAPPFNELVG
jgi:hypothetical protein